jgi:acyl-[acyl carrier protein]--UDP-N-acetylglucosamine O-acyltransferase
MKISELNLSGINVERDAVFRTLGLLEYNTNEMLVCFYSDKFTDKLLSNDTISCVVTTAELSGLIPKNMGLILSDNPLETFYEIHHYLADYTDFYWKPFATEVGKNCQIHEKSFIASENVKIGDNCVIQANATILPNTIIGDNVIVRPGAVIGTEGFEFKRINEKLVAIKHTGGVKIFSNVEIQANCTISKSVFGHFTEIGENTKLDNLVHIAHNVIVGKNCRIAASAMIAGSTIIGDNVWIGPNSTISSSINIEDEAQISLGAVVTTNVGKGVRMSGNFAVSHDKLISFLKQIR